MVLSRRERELGQKIFKAMILHIVHQCFGLINRIDSVWLTLSTRYSHVDLLCIALMWKTRIVWSTDWEGAANTQSLH